MNYIVKWLCVCDKLYINAFIYTVDWLCMSNNALIPS
jgi:hypothetical protein